MSDQQTLLPIKFEPVTEKLAKFYAELPEEHREPFMDALVPYINALDKICENLPKIIKGTTNAETVMARWTEMKTDEEILEVKALLGKVSESYQVNQVRRKEITMAADAMKDYLMNFERKVSTEAKEPNNYNRLKSLIQQEQQKILNKRREEEQAAAKRKARADYKSDLELQFIKNLSTMLATTVKMAEDSIIAFFDKLTVDNFDTEADKVNAARLKLKQEVYDKCFVVQMNTSLIDNDEFLILVTTVKEKEPYDKWNAEYIGQMKPIVEAWDKKKPDLKAQKVAIANAKDEAERKRLEDEKKSKEEAEAKQRQEQLAAKQKEIEDKAKDEAQLQKMENTFVQQGAEQNMGDPGLVKQSLRFTEDKRMPKAITEIIYHCVTHKDFYGIYQLDSKKVQKLDANGRPEYVPGIQWWITQFQKLKVDAHIEGTVLVEDSKVIIRK